MGFLPSALHIKNIPGIKSSFARYRQKIPCIPEVLNGFLFHTADYGFCSGLIEVLVSPIIEACPFDHKEAVMSMTHSFYCRGSVAVILLSTLFFRFVGIEKRPVLAAGDPDGLCRSF